MVSQKRFLVALRTVVSQSQFVSISQQAIAKYCQNFFQLPLQHWSQQYPLGYRRRENDNDELDFLFLVGSQAFYFWGYPKKWTIFYKGKKLDGWWALLACFERALEKGIPVFDGNYLADLSLNETRTLFAGEPEIPLLKERHRILKNIGKVLVRKYQGRFHQFYQKQVREAFPLLDSISKEFFGFDDVSTYKGRKVYFYKKAQLLLSDFYFHFEGKGYGAIKNVDLLPGCADYKIPMLMRRLGILEYRPQLAQKVDHRIELKSGSAEEVEIRANMLWAIQLMMRRLRKRITGINPFVIDGSLWLQSQEKHPNDKPYHLTETINY